MSWNLRVEKHAYNNKTVNNEEGDKTLLKYFLQNLFELNFINKCIL